MEVLNTIGAVMGIGLLSGFRLYGTVLALGAAIRMGWWAPAAHLKDLGVLADTRVLAVAGVLCAVEFLADKVAWVDSFWDSFHTIIRPVGAVLLASAALGEMDPVNKTLLSLLCGGMALAGHTSKAATRLAVNHSPEPFSNIGLSLAEDAVSAAGVWFVLEHPILALSITLGFLGIFFWLSPKVFRLLRVELIALWAFLARWFSTRGAPHAEAPALAAGSEPVQRLWGLLYERMDFMPAEYAQALAEKLGTQAPVAGVYCAGTRSAGGLRSSPGYVCFVSDRLSFVTRRWFRWRMHTVDLSGIQQVTLRRRLLLDQLCLRTTGGDVRFNLFKVAPLRVPEFSRPVSA